MLSLFSRKKTLLEEEVIEWIFNSYAWAMDEFDRDVFFNESTLVLPDNTYFPGSESSADGMANLILNQVKDYAGMGHWPTRLYNMTADNGQHLPNQSIRITGALRGKKAQEQTHSPDTIQSNDPTLLESPIPRSLISQLPLQTGDIHQTSNSIALKYHPQQLSSPEGIIAYFAHELSHHLAGTAKTEPPGGPNYLPMAGELTGVFMGFGIMFANSAIVQRRGGCGGCGGGQSPVRQVFLNEEEITYALAVFCHLKSIDSGKVTKHLKKYLRGFFKAAMKDCKSRLEHHETLMLTN